MRDRDRVVHCSAFRRLEYKTQVFVYHEGDYYRTRLTHTIEVAQIARSIASMLRLNADLCEAIALSHDLGHPPFGHSGEKALHELMVKEGSWFEHNLHTMRLVDHVESHYPDFRGLNLTWETREAIARHAKRDDESTSEFKKYPNPSVEAQITDLADSIAYNSHDLDDGLTSGLLDMESLKETKLWSSILSQVPGGERLSGKLLKYQVIRGIINAQVTDLIKQTVDNVKRLSIGSADEARAQNEKVATFSEDMLEAHKELKIFLRENMYKSYRVVRMEVKAFRVVTDLFKAYDERPELLIPNVKKHLESENKHRLICDYIAGMTDKMALEEHQKLFDPMSRV